MARAVLRRQFVDGPLKQYPRKPQLIFYAIGLHFLRQTFLMTLFYHSSTIYTALIFLCPFNHPYLSILFPTYSMFGWSFRIFLFYFHFHLVTDFRLSCYQSRFR